MYIIVLKRNKNYYSSCLQVSDGGDKALLPLVSEHGLLPRHEGRLESELTTHHQKVRQRVRLVYRSDRQ